MSADLAAKYPRDEVIAGLRSAGIPDPVATYEALIAEVKHTVACPPGVCPQCGSATGPKPPPTRYQEAARSLAIDDVIELAQSLTQHPWPDRAPVVERIKAIIEENWRT